tara:strand:+ start:142 stop:531 length:390 start_codon:yes stop_codon:yes gene_type:complete
MTKLTKFIPLTFTASPRTSARISVPFKVKTIHIKSAGYTASDVGTLKYISILSDLVMNNPIAILYQDTSFSSACVQDIEHQFWNPIDINGTFNFWLVNMDNSVGATSNGGAGTDKVGFIIEFNSAEEIM